MKNKKTRRRFEGLAERQAAFDRLPLRKKQGRKRPGSLNRKRTHRSRKVNV